MGPEVPPVVLGWSGRLRHPSLGGALGLLFIAAGLAIGLRSLADNSFLTHLATGRLILETGSVPSRDPYTFTAAGEPWVVQSWLASVLYAAMERLGGLDAVRVLTGSLAALLAGLSWHLVRPADGVIVRLGLGALALTVGGGLWTERPYMFGLVAFALLLLAAEGRLHPAWLVPVGWIWVNTHGSYPLGLVYLAVAAVGSRLDDDRATTELRCLRWAVPGMLAGAIGPLGLRVLSFPVELLGRQDVLSNVVEWQAPTFTSLSQRAFLVQVALALVLLARRPSYRAALIVAVYTLAALLGARNVVVASLALLPVMATASGGWGSLKSADRPPYTRLVAAAGVALTAVVVGARLDLASLSLSKYPVDALAYLESSGVDLEEHHLAAPDYVGNFLEYAYGPGERVFYDDRFDMFPGDISDAARALLRLEPDVFQQLAAFDIELLAVPREDPMTLILTRDPGWRSLYQDESWVLSCRRGAALAGTVGTC